MQLIQIEITARRPRVLGSPVLVCNNTGDYIAFTFDDEWAEAKDKTARFVYNKDGKVFHTDVQLNSRDRVEIPPLENTRDVRVGVFAGTLATTTAARIPCEPSILCGSGDEQVDFYALGRQAEWDQFWDAFQQKGVRNYYDFGAFGAHTTAAEYQFWTDENFRPKYDILVGFGLVSMSSYGLFALNTALTHIPVRIIPHSAANVAKATFDYMFYACYALKTIKGLRCRNFNSFSNTFQSCAALEDVTFEGAIGNDINLQWSENLSDDSLRSLALALINYDGKDEANTKTVYLPDSIKERLFDIFFDADEYADNEWYGCSVEDVILFKCWNY